MIKAENVELIYPDGTKALKDVNFELNKGRLVYLIGSSGSGKTSLLKLLMGMEYPTKGKLTVLNQKIEENNSKKIRVLRTKIGPVFQEFRLLSGRTSLENVMVGLRFLDLSKSEIKEASVKALCRVGLEHKINTDVRNLSWGERQRVAIARAVARKPAIIIADEPTGNLDQENSLKIMELLASFVDDETTVIITTHATHLLDEFRDGIIGKVSDGNITWEI